MQSDMDRTNNNLNRVDFSMRVCTEDTIFGSNVMVVIKMVTGEVKRVWMSGGNPFKPTYP